MANWVVKRYKAHIKLRTQNYYIFWRTNMSFYWLFDDIVHFKSFQTLFCTLIAESAIRTCRAQSFTCAIPSADILACWLHNPKSHHENRVNLNHQTPCYLCRTAFSMLMIELMKIMGSRWVIRANRALKADFHSRCPFTNHPLVLVSLLVFLQSASRFTDMFITGLLTGR